MRAPIAIVDNAVVRAGRKVDAALRAYTAAEANAKERRLELGRSLIEARQLFPKTGRNAGGWSRFVAERGINMDVALDAMKYAGYVDEHCGPDDPLPTRAEAGIDKPAEKVPAGADPLSAAPQLSLVPDPEPDPGPAPEVEIDRDTWCTPPWLTEPLGRFDLDPCSNERSSVRAVQSFNFERAGEDGLELASAVWASARVFINPPYSDVEPWIEAYKHTRFCFLLKLDTSTKWFAKLYAATELILIPRRRVNFIPPPGVPKAQAQAQQFPHALFYRFAEDATDAVRALSWSWRVDHT